MTTIACPWCEKDAPVLLRDLLVPGCSLTCAHCGTTVEILEDAVEFDLAA